MYSIFYIFFQHNFNLGHVKMYRVTHAEREEKKKTDKKDKKDKDAEEDERNKLTIHFVKYTLGLKHQVSENKNI